ncbi:MAG: hypothetical protein ACYTBJ_27360 [Planctomycetota bacterium]
MLADEENTDIQIAELRALAEDRYFEFDGGIDAALDVFCRFLEETRTPTKGQDYNWQKAMREHYED